jgi:hypothetical protein
VLAHYLHFLEDPSICTSLKRLNKLALTLKKLKNYPKARRVPMKPKDRHTRVQNNTVKECEKNDRKNSHSLFNKEWNK